MGMNTEFRFENIKGRIYVGIVETGKMILLKCILKTRELNVTVSEQDPVKGFCKQLSVQDIS
jgi:hypothetical protein